MKVGKLNGGDCIAYWLQIWKVRIGFFTFPLGALWTWGARRCNDLGWMVAFGPFQVCYYRQAC